MVLPWRKRSEIEEVIRVNQIRSSNNENWRNSAKIEGRLHSKMKEKIQPSILKVNLLGTMHNENNPSIFEEGIGNVKTLKSLSKIFDTKNINEISIIYPKTKSWIIAHTYGNNVCLKVPKVNEVIQNSNEQNLFQQQHDRLDPTYTYMNNNQDKIKKLRLNVITTRGILKKLMVLPGNHCTVIIRKNDQGVLYLRKPFYQGGSSSIDVSTGITFEEYLSEGPSNIWDRVKQFYGIFHATIGDSSILYHGEIDAFNSNSTCSMDSSRGVLVKDLIEVKTVSSDTFYGKGKSCTYFYTQRLAEWWAQCKLVGIEQLICGVLNEKHQPYSIRSDFIELIKILHLNVSEFSSENQEISGGENIVWSEQILTHQLKIVMSKIRERCQEPDIDINQNYRITVIKYKNEFTGETEIKLQEPRKWQQFNH